MIALVNSQNLCIRTKIKKKVRIAEISEFQNLTLI